MSTNIRFFDRWIRIFLGSFLLTWAMAGGPWWAYTGLYLLASGAARICIIYALFEGSAKSVSNTRYD